MIVEKGHFYFAEKYWVPKAPLPLRPCPDGLQIVPKITLKKNLITFLQFSEIFLEKLCCRILVRKEWILQEWIKTGQAY